MHPNRVLAATSLLALAAAFAAPASAQPPAPPAARPNAAPKPGAARPGDVVVTGTRGAGIATPDRVRVSVANPDPAPLDMVVVRLRLPKWVRVRHGDHPYATPVAAASVAEVDLDGTALRWGRHPLGPVVAYGVACDGLLVTPPVSADPIDPL